MNIKIERPEPCGACAFCKLAAEVVKMLEFIDRRFFPDMAAACREMSEAKWYGYDHGYDYAARRYSRLKEQWYQARERVLQPSVIHAMTCPTTWAIRAIITPDVPEPRDLTAQPRERELEPVVDGCQCFSCGGPLRDPPMFGVEVCSRCFGRTS